MPIDKVSYDALPAAPAIFTVIVTFNGNWDTVGALVHSCNQAKVGYVIVDNGSGDAAGLKPFNTIFLEQNLGIAAAQNAGIAHCRAAGAGIIVFFDQDSVIPAGFLEALVAPIVAQAAHITAPVFYDIEQGFSYPIVRISSHGFRSKFYPEHLRSPLLTNVVISSGTAVSAEVFAAAGVMNADLFIDYVDTEWCLRCFAKGYTVLINPDVRMNHSIGDRTVQLGRFKVPVHSPLRRYYRIRNAFLLLRMAHVPKVMALREVAFSIAHQLFIVLISKQRWQYMKYLGFGIWHGIRNRAGRF